MKRWLVVPAALLATLAGCGQAATPSPAVSSSTPAAAAPAPTTVPVPTTAPAPTKTRFDHILVVILENKAATQLDGNQAAPYLNGLIRDSALLTRSSGITHPSQPNYLALFAGSTYGVTDNQCPLALGRQPNLGRQLLDAGLTFTGYSEGLPHPGFTGCSSGRYAAKHNPWVHFGNIPASANQPATAFPRDYSQLPTVAFLVPDLCNDTHDCPIATGDEWLAGTIDGYARWARDHNSLLVVTYDEDDTAHDNHIVTVLSGAGVRPGRYDQPINHYGVLATIEDLCGLARLGQAAKARPVTGVWG